MDIKNKKRAFIKTKLVGIISPYQRFFDKENEKLQVEKDKKEMFFRRVIEPSELIKPKNKEDAKRLRRREQNLGMRIYV